MKMDPVGHCIFDLVDLRFILLQPCLESMNGKQESISQLCKYLEMDEQHFLDKKTVK